MVEPMSLICLGGAALVATVNHVEKRSEKAQRIPPSLTSALEFESDGEVNDLILTVHVGRATLSTRLANTELMVRVKYGERGESIACDSKTALAKFEHSVASKFVAQLDSAETSSVAASFDTTCLFSAVPRGMPLRIRLMHQGRFNHTVATAEIDVPSPSEFTTPTKETLVCLRDKHHNEIGHVTLNLGLMNAKRNHLRMQLAQLGAHKQQSTFAIHNLQVAEGTVVVDSLVKELDAIYMGESAMLCSKSSSINSLY